MGGYNPYKLRSYNYNPIISGRGPPRRTIRKIRSAEHVVFLVRCVATRCCFFRRAA